MGIVILLFVGVFGFIISDASKTKLNTQRVIPVRNQAAAAEFVNKQMDALKNMTTRNDDEDYDDFLEQANDNALKIYGIDTTGVYQNGSFVPWDRIPKELKSQISY